VHDNDKNAQSTITFVTAKESILPKFRRVRKVEVDDTSTFRCSCNFFERFGIPCCHMLSILSKFPNYEEPSTQNGVSAIYWKRYVFFC